MGDGVAEDGLPVANPREAERRLWAAFGRGVLVDLRVGDLEADDPAHADNWDESRRVRAEVVVALLLRPANPVAGSVPKVRLAGAVVEGSLDVRQGIVGCAAELTGCRFASGVLLSEAHTHTLDFSRSVLETIDATAAEISGHLIFYRCQAQAIKVELAHISGRLVLDGAHLSNPGEDALYADGMTVDGDMFCKEGFKAEGKVLERFQAEGTVRLPGAHIGGQLVLNGAHLSNPGEDALYADGMTVDGDMFCKEGFKAEGKVLERFQAEGEVRLPGAHIGGQLVLNGAHLSNPGEDALYADGMTVDLGMFCLEGFEAEGKVRERFQAEGTVSLLGAHISMQLALIGAALSSQGKTALECETLTADSLWLDSMTVTGTVNLRSAQVRVIHDNPSNWQPGQMLLDGFSYNDLQPYAAAGRHGQPGGRLSWLAHAEADYRPQPYEQLAAYYRRLGHDKEARRVLVAKQRRRRAGLGAGGKIVGYALDGIVGYGYKPVYAFAWLVILLAAGSVYFTINRPAPLNPAQHPHYQPVLYVANLLIPIVNLGQGNTWAPAGAAQWVAAALIAMGWILATAVVAGITRVLTRA